MNRRSFLKRFSAAVVGTVVAVKMPLSTPLVERVAVAKETYHNLADVIEIPLDPTTTMRITKMQYLIRAESFKAKGYELTGNILKYSPKYIDLWDEDDWDSV